MGCAGSKNAVSLDGESGSEAAASQGSGSSPSPNPQKAANKPKKRKGRLLQVLVAGYQQSGKSTFFKQLQIIHLNGWAHEYATPAVDLSTTLPPFLASFVFPHRL